MRRVSRFTVADRLIMSDAVAKGIARAFSDGPEAGWEDEMQRNYVVGREVPTGIPLALKQSKD